MNRLISILTAFAMCVVLFALSACSLLKDTLPTSNSLSPSNITGLPKETVTDAPDTTSVEPAPPTVSNAIESAQPVETTDTEPPETTSETLVSEWLTPISGSVFTEPFIAFV